MRDEQVVAIARPRQQNRFTIGGSEVAEFAAAGSTALVVGSTSAFAVNNRCQVVLDDGNVFFFTITSIVGATLNFAAQPLPSGVGGSFGDPLENAVINLTTAA